MSSEQLSTRILSEQSRIKSNDIRRGKATEEELEDILKPLEIYMIYHFILMKPCNNNFDFK